MTNDNQNRQPFRRPQGGNLGRVPRAPQAAYTHFDPSSAARPSSVVPPPRSHGMNGAVPPTQDHGMNGAVPPVQNYGLNEVGQSRRADMTPAPHLQAMLQRAPQGDRFIPSHEAVLDEQSKSESLPPAAVAAYANTEKFPLPLPDLSTAGPDSVSLSQDSRASGSSSAHSSHHTSTHSAHHSSGSASEAKSSRTGEASAEPPAVTSSEKSRSDNNSHSESSSTKSKEESKEKLDPGRKLSVMMGILCFIVGALLLVFMFSPLQPGAERVLSDENVHTLTKPEANVVSEGMDNSANFAEETTEVLPASAAARRPSRSGSIKVYVVGAVNRPGMVTLPPEARVDDAVKAAGGMSPEAEPLSVNLAKRIKDEDKIYIASKTESASDPVPEAEYNREVPLLQRSGVIEQAPPVESEVAPTPAKRRKSSSKRKTAAANQETAPSSGESAANSAASNKSGKPVINLNTCSEEDLQTLPGIGPSISKSIVEERAKQPGGRYTDVKQLKDVPGVGEATFNSIAPEVGI